MTTSGAITTHVLDVARGKPAHDVGVQLFRLNSDGAAELVGSGKTDADGRAKSLLAGSALQMATYRLCLHVGDYHEALGRRGFFPTVTIDFRVDDAEQHYHVPLLLSPFGYSTYRGS